MIRIRYWNERSSLVFLHCFFVLWMCLCYAYAYFFSLVFLIPIVLGIRCMYENTSSFKRTPYISKCKCNRQLTCRKHLFNVYAIHHFYHCCIIKLFKHWIEYWLKTVKFLKNENANWWPWAMVNAQLCPSSFFGIVLWFFLNSIFMPLSRWHFFKFIFKCKSDMEKKDNSLGFLCDYEHDANGFERRNSKFLSIRYIFNIQIMWHRRYDIHIEKWIQSSVK